jgi:hypothetical protein
MNRPLAGGVVLFTGTVDLDAQYGGGYDWVGLATTTSSVSYACSHLQVF